MIITENIQVDFFSNRRGSKEYKLINLTPDISFSWDTQCRSLARVDPDFTAWDEFTFYVGWLNWLGGLTVSFKYNPNKGYGTKGNKG